jgi:phytoene desaturase
LYNLSLLVTNNQQPATNLIIIIGAGMGGLAAAIRLRVAGHNVQVLEANAYTGGKLGVLEKDGYRWDTGPSLFTQPSYHADLFQLAGKNPDDYFSYQRIDPVCRYFWPDGSQLTAHADKEKLAEELASVFGENPRQVQDYLKRAEEKFALAGEIFLNRPLQKLSSYTDAKVARAIWQIGKLQMLKTLHSLNRQTFKHSNTVQLFDRYATYNGSDPYQTSALYSLIPSFEFGDGAYFPTGGMAAIGQSLTQLAMDIGVEMHLNTPVDGIERVGKKVSGVYAKGRFWPADVVVSNSDITALYKKLLPDVTAPKKTLSQPLSTSAIVFYWGIKGQFAELGLHNVFFSSDYKKEFQELFQEKIWSTEPTIYLNISSKYKADDAPPGCENWFVMVNVPARTDIETPENLATLRHRVITILTKRLGRNVEELIACEEVLTPSLLQSRTSAHFGALYGSNSNNLFSGFWRHPNFSDQIEGMFFTGGTVHPGGGIPLALKSGQIAAQLATQYLKGK